MARYAKGHKEESRGRLLQAAARGFRLKGLGGAGVDGLSSEAGVTHGAFYAHFRSKAEAFRAAMVDGLEQLRDGVKAAQAEHGEQWAEHFIDFYLSRRRTCDLGEACMLPTLSSEIERTDAPTRAAYQAVLDQVIEALASGLPGPGPAQRRALAWSLLSLLAGAVTLARAVPEAAISEEIARAARSAALASVHAAGQADVGR